MGWFRRRAGIIGMAITTGSGCAAATSGSTVGSGVGDTFLAHPPWYAGATRGDLMGRSLRVGHLPVAYQRRVAQSPVIDPDLIESLRGLLRDLTMTLDSAGVSRPLSDAAPDATAGGMPGGAPDVSFGCITTSGDPSDDCAERGDSVLGRGDQRMRLAVTRASSKEWTEWIDRALREADLDAVILITLEVGEYLPRQRGITGQKEVELGSSHVEPLPWLTSLETPVMVLQLTGALIGRDGKAIRIGAEGLMARPTSLPVSAVGAVRLITDADVEALRSARRQDLNGAPLTWETGLRTLASELVGRGPLAVPRRPM